MLLKMWRKENPCVLLVGMLIGVATVENSTKVPWKLKNRTTIQSSNSTSGYLTKENKNITLQELPEGVLWFKTEGLDSNSKAYEEIKNMGKGNYICKYKSQYYCIFGL